MKYIMLLLSLFLLMGCASSRCYITTMGGGEVCHPEDEDEVIYTR